VAGEVADHQGGVGEQVGQIVSVVGLDEDPLVGQGDRHPRHRFPCPQGRDRSDGGHRDPAGPFRVEGGQRLPPAGSDHTLDQEGHRGAAVGLHRPNSWSDARPYFLGLLSRAIESGGTTLVSYERAVT
jgi:hypothetical protein